MLLRRAALAAGRTAPAHKLLAQPGCHGTQRKTAMRSQWIGPATGVSLALTLRCQRSRITPSPRNSTRTSPSRSKEPSKSPLGEPALVAVHQRDEAGRDRRRVGGGWRSAERATAPRLDSRRVASRAKVTVQGFMSKDGALRANARDTDRCDTGPDASLDLIEKPERFLLQYEMCRGLVGMRLIGELDRVRAEPNAAPSLERQIQRRIDGGSILDRAM